MTDPVRLIESLDEEGRLLLQAGRAGAPRGAKERSLAAATAVIAASTLGGGSAAAGTATAAAFGSGKWLAIVGLASLGALGGTVAVQEMRRSPAMSTTAPAPASTRLPAPAVRPVLPQAIPAPAATRSVQVTTEATTTEAALSQVSQPSVAPTKAPNPKVERPREQLQASGQARASVPAPATPPLAATEPAASSALSFSAELRSLDEARAAVAAKEPARALGILDGYTARFPRGAMAPEAAVLRIEALANAGDHAAAERVAEAFLRENPGSPYAPRVRSLLGSNP
jgi:hypothetical protein